VNFDVKTISVELQHL